MSRFERLKEMFERASSLEGDARAELLNDVQAEDPGLFRELELLLREDAEGSATLEQGVAAAARGALAPEPGASASPAEAIVERIASRGAPHERYRVEGEFARGGMGVILKVWDEDLHRPLAMKVQRTRMGRGADPDRTLGRFLEEAQVTGQLDHPGIVPVHDLGTSAGGEVYFTMKLVQGRDLKAVFGLVAEGEEGWNTTRAVRVIHRVCEAMAYAHAKGVVHRDLKPANVMVGRFGEVYVMDWGLARVLDAGEDEGGDASPRTFSELRETEGTPEVAQLTREGDVLGTPAYMPPEQAYGRTAEIGPQADVYAVGAILYHLLAGRPPYAVPGKPKAPGETLVRLVAGPPAPLSEVAPEAPVELVSVCEKAMQRDRPARYAGMAELGADLEAWLEGRVVRAYETGAWAEARKWVKRNRGLAASLAAALVIGVGGLTGISVTEAKGRREANAEREVAVRERNNVLRLSAFQRLRELEQRARELWPAVPSRAQDMAEWLKDAELLVAGLDGDPSDPEDSGHRAQLAALRAAHVDGAPPDEQSAWWEAQLEELIARIEAFADDETGLAGSGTYPAQGSASELGGWGVRQRLERAERLAEESVSGERAARLWADALDWIGDPDECPDYAGLALAPQLGLLPLGQDPSSGLWEFVDVQTGAVPERDPEGRLVITAETGVVFVLVPGGIFRMGAQNEDRFSANYDPEARGSERPVHDVEVSPIFVSKYEMTQGQWQRVTGHNPTGLDRFTSEPTLHHPVEGLNWLEAAEVLGRLGMRLPTEAEWEHAARAGTTSRWWTGAERESLEGAVNLSDRTASRNGATWDVEEWLEDGHTIHAPAGTYRPNPFGLHEVYGNVAELCADVFLLDYYISEPPPRRDPRARPQGEVTAETVIVVRGGSYADTLRRASSAFREQQNAEWAAPTVGLRPVRVIDALSGD